uniref:Uncharacterized protein n=1 Tax=Graphocephala atropunctata TaxID=36148 RepID=A0A1B6LYV9_9HEMI
MTIITTTAEPADPMLLLHSVLLRLSEDSNHLRFPPLTPLFCFSSPFSGASRNTRRTKRCTATLWAARWTDVTEVLSYKISDPRCRLGSGKYSWSGPELVFLFQLKIFRSIKRISAEEHCNAEEENIVVNFRPPLPLGNRELRECGQI